MTLLVKAHLFGRMVVLARIDAGDITNLIMLEMKTVHTYSILNIGMICRVHMDFLATSVVYKVSFHGIFSFL